MKNLKKKVAGAILGGAIGVLSCMPVLAAQASASPYVLVRSCQECGTGRVTTTTSTELLSEEVYDYCEHNVPGAFDSLRMYKVVERSYCDSCTYSLENQYPKFVWCCNVPSN